MYAKLNDGFALALRGKDVRRFCNGLFTNNVRDLSVSTGHRTAMCDTKGRMVALLELQMLAEDHVVLMFEGGDPELLCQQLEKYIVFDDVVLSKLDSSIFGVFDEPEIALTFPRLWLGKPAGYLLANAPPAKAKERTSEEWLSLRVCLGRPTWPENGFQKVLLFELGLRDEVCNFSKGCYVGQEILNRLDVMGQTRRRVVRVVSKDPLFVGQEVLLEGEVLGVLSSPCVNTHSQGWQALALVRHPHAECGQVLMTSTGQAVTIVLPEIPLESDPL